MFPYTFQDDITQVSPTEIPPPTAVNTSRQRIMVCCTNINFSLRGVVKEGADEPITNVSTG